METTEESKDSDEEVGTLKDSYPYYGDGSGRSEPMTIRSVRMRDNVEQGSELSLPNSVSKKKGLFSQPQGTMEYTVKSTDKLASIALAHDSTTSQLMRLNHLTSSMIFPGQKLYVPDPDSSEPVILSPTNKTFTSQPENNFSTAASRLDIPPISMKPKKAPDVPVVSAAPERPKKSRIFPRSRSKDEEGRGSRERKQKYRKKGVVKKQNSTPIPGRVVRQSDGSTPGEETDENSKQFLKLDVKYITDGEGVVSGTMLVTPNAIMFDPNVSDPLVIERGVGSYGVITQMDIVVGASMYHDISAMSLKAQAGSDNISPTVYIPEDKIPSSESKETLSNGTTPQGSEQEINMQENADNRTTDSPSGKVSLIDGAVHFRVANGVEKMDDHVQSKENDVQKEENDVQNEENDVQNIDDVTADNDRSMMIRSDSPEVDLGLGEEKRSEDLVLEKGCSVGQDQVMDPEDALMRRLSERSDEDTQEDKEDKMGSEVQDKASEGGGRGSPSDIEMKEEEEVCGQPGTVQSGLEAGAQEMDNRDDERISEKEGERDVEEQNVEVKEGDTAPLMDTSSNLIDPDSKENINQGEPEGRQMNDLGEVVVGAEDQPEKQDSEILEKELSSAEDLPPSPPPSPEHHSTEDNKETSDIPATESNTSLIQEGGLGETSPHEETPAPLKAGEEESVFDEASKDIPSNDDGAKNSVAVSAASVKDGESKQAFVNFSSGLFVTDKRKCSMVQDMSECIVTEDGIFERKLLEVEEGGKELKRLSELDLVKEKEDGSVEERLAEEGVKEKRGETQSSEESATTAPSKHEEGRERSSSEGATTVKLVYLSKNFEEFRPRPAQRYEDPPLYLCLKVYRPMKKTFVAPPPGEEGSMEDNAKRKAQKSHKLPEYWFAIPREKAANLYNFFLQWSPEKYGKEVSHEDLGFVPIEQTEAMTEVVENFFSEPILKDWEIVSREEANRRRMTLLECEMDLPLPELLGESRLLETVHIGKLRKELPPRTVGYNWSMIYNTASDGFSLRSLYRTMQEWESPVLLLLEDASDYLFGALASCPLRESEAYYGTGESFLFQFQSGEDVTDLLCYRWTGENMYFIKGDRDSISIGGGEGTIGLWLDGDLYHGRCRRCKTFDNEILSGTEDFVIKNLEVWGFVM